MASGASEPPSNSDWCWIARMKVAKTPIAACSLHPTITFTRNYPPTVTPTAHSLTMPPQTRGSGRKRQRSPSASPAPQPTRARYTSGSLVIKRGLSADNIPDEELSERKLRLKVICDDIKLYFYALREAKEKLGVDSIVVQVLEKVKSEAFAEYKRLDGEETPDVESTEDEVPEDQPEVLTLEQRQMNLESELSALRGNVFPMIEDLERAVLALREEIEGRQESEDVDDLSQES